MENYVKRMVEEHSQLVMRINKLDNFLYGNGGLNVHTNIKNNQTQDDLFKNMTEFANKAIQLRSMKTYLLALECRLNNEGIFYEDGEYLERIAKIVKEQKEPLNDFQLNANKENV